MGSSELYSYHVFLFPFQWEYMGKRYQNKTIEEKNNLDFFCKAIKKENWNRKKLELNTALAYNEYNYFYDFVRDTLYDKDFPPRPDRQVEKDGERFIAHFEYNILPDSLTYSFEAKGKKYALLIESIILHLYNTGVGVLSFHLNNRDESQAGQEDILKINQYGRRIYPPFFSVLPHKIGTQAQYEPVGFQDGLKRVQNAELASNIQIGNEPAENFVDYGTTINFRDEGVFRLPGFIRQLFGNLPIITNRNKKWQDKTEILLSPVLDDRMFVVCWYGNNDIVDVFRKYNSEKSDFEAIKNYGKFTYLTHEWLYKFTFIDVSLTCRNKDMMAGLLKEHINPRWLDYGTLFGVGRYSFVCLTQPLTDDGFRNTSGFVVNHLQTMYYKMAELCLVQRACIMRFSDEVAEISAMKPSLSKKLESKVSSLYKQYIRFVNRIYFREVTAQEQGIELYDMLQEKMKLREHVKDLDGEIEELHNYLQMEEQKEQNREVARLTIIAATFLPATLVAGVLGMNNLFEDFGPETSNNIKALWLNIGFIFLSLMIGLIIANYIFWVRSFKRKKYG